MEDPLKRSDIIDAVAEQALRGDQKAARAAVAVVIETITRGLAEGDRVHVADLGVFRTEEIPERLVRNPRTGEQVKAESKVRVRFRPAETLKRFLSGEEEVPAPRRWR